MDDIQKRILTTILEYGQIRGFELQREVGIPADELARAVRPLLERRLVTASGAIRPETIDRVQFAPLSSAVERKSFL